MYFFVSFSDILFAQIKKPFLSIPINISDGTTNKKLLVGLDSEATDSIDALFGEEELPPLPPPGIFDARLIAENSGVNLGNGSLVDIRRLIHNQTQKIFRIALQYGNNSQTILKWNIPQNVYGNLKDEFGGIIINQQVSDSGSITLNNENITALTLEINFEKLVTGITKVNKTHDFQLLQNYPNPFNGYTTIRFSLIESDFIDITIYNSIGKEIKKVLSAYTAVGDHSIGVELNSYPSGVYFYKFKTSSYQASKKLILLK